MADQKEKQIQEAKELQAAIESITSQKDTLEQQCKALKDEQAQGMAKIQELQTKQATIGQEITSKTAKLEEIKQLMYQRESEYMALLEASPTLVSVMKKG
eukprot:CAMPEP_0175270664 /NCGR_PEP_ID=MMETSP0093-20121207/45501_1 /TAXON_ID=311494 /ORGANISM="Alexandrium monilatum, Strain CCMP3105" /LENGTH=99 /DNA_ID=CAMNT_0016565379 /DNA_START=84 /DNA_END=383 /DNA_ORIENTATION=-